MRIGIDARLWSEAGVGRYIRNLVLNLAEIDRENNYFLFLLKENLGQNLGKNFTEVEADFKWYGFEEQRKLPTLLKKYNLNLIHFPHFNIPIFYSGKFVVTIHDLIHQHHRMKRATTLNPLIYRVKHYAYNQALKASLKKSQKVITVSEFVKQQLIKEMQVFESKIEVIYEAVESQLIAIAMDCDSGKINRVHQKYGIRSPFVFYVGNAHPHKNVEGLIEAFESIQKVGIKNLQLVLSGHDHYFWEKIKKNVKDAKGIVFTGYVSDEELVALYKSAQCFVFPSFEEGFGIPLLESMALGCPVVSSDKGSLPEIGGDAAIYFNPENLGDMVEKILLVLNSEKLSKELVAKGKKRYREFSWRKLAEETLKVYNDSL